MGSRESRGSRMMQTIVGRKRGSRESRTGRIKAKLRSLMRGTRPLGAGMRLLGMGIRP
jgi:hypothetical protein